MMHYHGNLNLVYELHIQECTSFGNIKMNNLKIFLNTWFLFVDDGEVYVWDMNTRDCIHKFIDDGCIKGTSIAVSPNGQHLATG